MQETNVIPFPRGSPRTMRDLEQEAESAQARGEYILMVEFLRRAVIAGSCEESESDPRHFEIVIARYQQAFLTHVVPAELRSSVLGIYESILRLSAAGSLEPRHFISEMLRIAKILIASGAFATPNGSTTEHEQRLLRFVESLLLESILSGR